MKKIVKVFMLMIMGATMFTSCVVDDDSFNTNEVVEEIVDTDDTTTEDEEENPTQIEEDVSYNVWFDTKGGSYISSIIVKKGDKVEKPTDPTKEGYVFNGWNFDFDTIIENDTEITVNDWIEIVEEIDDEKNDDIIEEVEPIIEPKTMHTVTFYQCDERQKITSVEVEEGKSIETLPIWNDERGDYPIFNCWMDKDGNVFDENTVITSDMNVYANSTCKLSYVVIREFKMGAYAKVTPSTSNYSLVYRVLYADNGYIEFTYQGEKVPNENVDVEIVSEMVKSIKVNVKINGMENGDNIVLNIHKDSKFRNVVFVNGESEITLYH